MISLNQTMYSAFALKENSQISGVSVLSLDATTFFGDFRIFFGQPRNSCWCYRVMTAHPSIDKHEQKNKTNSNNKKQSLEGNRKSLLSCTWLKPAPCLHAIISMFSVLQQSKLLSHTAHTMTSKINGGPAQTLFQEQHQGDL